MLETDHARDEKFKDNFFRDFQAMVNKYPPVSRSRTARTSLTDQERRHKGQITG
jgi:hypothetical protein